MIKKYLENYRQELLEKKIDLEKAYQRNELSIKENIGFIQLLEESEDKNYNSFSPKTVFQNNSDKIKNLKEQQKRMEENRDKISMEMSNLSRKLDELSSIIKVAKENEIHQKSLKKMLDDKELFRLKLLETQECERQRIARDLHDSTVQSLTGMIHKIELCNKLMDMDPVRCKLELQTVSKTLREIIQDMRKVIYDLRPMPFDDIGLDVTLERELSRIKNDSMININYSATGDSKGIIPVVSLSMLRIIQEACNNTIKHAKAKNISVEIEYGEEWLILNIEDDGKGFDTSKIKIIDSGMESGFGISMMNERVYLLSGTIHIESEINKGTKIQVRIPQKKEELIC